MKAQNKIFGFLVALAITTLAGPLGADAQAKQRSIEDFIAAQGTFCVPNGSGGCLLFVGPHPNFLAFRQPEPERCAVVDYAGIANRWLQEQSGEAVSLGTTVNGTVTERPTKLLEIEGVEIHVRLLTRNALTWVTQGCNLLSDPLLFGHRASEVLAGADAALADVVFEIKYVDFEPEFPNLLDLVQLLAFPLGDQALVRVAFQASAAGELREAFGVQDGTPGRAAIVSVSLNIHNPGAALLDGVPVVRIDLLVAGR